MDVDDPLGAPMVSSVGASRKMAAIAVVTITAATACQR